MRWPFFDRKCSLLDVRVLEGATDWHSHILPGVDDGIRTMQAALSTLAYYERIGYREVWLTPHVLEDMPNTPAGLRRRFSELEASYQGSIKLHLAAEHMVCDLFGQRLATGDVLPLGEGQDHLLIEFPLQQPPVGLISTINKIQEQGYRPVIAHPERYEYMEIGDLEMLKDKGCRLQLNVPSLVCGYGRGVMRKALEMLSLGLYDISGSDLHDLGHFEDIITDKQLVRGVADRARALSHCAL